MDLKFYPVCEHLLDRRRFLQFAMVAGLSPDLLSNPPKIRGVDQGSSRLVTQYALTPSDPWALAHAIRALGKDCSLAGESAAAYILRTCVRQQEVRGKHHLYIPATVEVHTNMFLKTLLEAGIPLSAEVWVDKTPLRLKDLGEGAKALFRFAPSNAKQDQFAWSLIAFAELQADEWDNVYGQRIRLKEVAAFCLESLQEATAGLRPYVKASLPLSQRLPIHGFTCGGTHLLYSLLVAARHRFLGADGCEALQEQLHILHYRLQADPDLIDLYYRNAAEVHGAEIFRAGAKLKILGHALECFGYATANDLFRPGRAEREAIRKAAREVRKLMAYTETLDLEKVRQWNAQLFQQIVGDSCHAVRGLNLA